MDSIAQRIETRKHVERDGRIDEHRIACRNAEELCKRTVAIHAHALRVLAKMTPAGEAVSATATNDVSLAIDEIARLEALYIRSYFRDYSDKLVPDHHGRPDGFLRPRVPVINVHIRAADRRLLDLNQDIVDSGHGHGDFRQFKAGPGMKLRNGTHGLRSHGRFASVTTRAAGSKQARGTICEAASSRATNTGLSSETGRAGRNVLFRQQLRAFQREQLHFRRDTAWSR